MSNKLDATSYNFTMVKQDGFLIITYDTDKEFIFNTTNKLTYKKDVNLTNCFYVEDKKDGKFIRLDYTKCTSHVESSLNDFLHDLRKIISAYVKDFNTELALGNIEGSEIYLKFGEHCNLGVTKETLWCQEGIWQPLVGTTGETMNIVSTSVQDVAVTGTGARSLVIYGLTTDDIQLTEIISLNGTTQVTTTNLFNHIHRVIVLTAGSTHNNVGDITLTASTTGTIQSKIPAEGGITQQLFFKSPKNHKIQIRSGFMCVHTTDAKVTFEMWYHYPSGVRIKTTKKLIRAHKTII